MKAPWPISGMGESMVHALAECDRANTMLKTRPMTTERINECLDFMLVASDLV